MRPVPVSCPACGMTLRGHPTTGYRCVRCHAFYSTRHMRAMRREHFKELISAHFGAQANTGRAPALSPRRKENEIIDDAVFIEDDDGGVAQALEQAHGAAIQTARHLDDFVSGASRVEEDREALVKAATALRHEPRAIAYRPKAPVVRIARRKKAIVRKKQARGKTLKRRVVIRKKKSGGSKAVTRRRTAKRVTRRRR